MNIKLCLTLIIITLIKYSSGDGSCGEWTSYKDEKCFILLDNVETHQNAIDLCKKVSKTGTLASIVDNEEQSFIEQYLFKQKNTVNNVWIGAKRDPNNKTKFQWEDGNLFGYSNWDKDAVLSPADDCVEMQAQKPYFDTTTKLGKWIDVKCDKKNQVLCQIPQTWPLDKLVLRFLELRKITVDLQHKSSDSVQNLTNELNKLKDSTSKAQTSLSTGLDNAQKSITNINANTASIQSNPVPINFTYIQLPSQPEPSALWPQVKWEDVSNLYAGLFFRVMGGASDKFGTIQAENSPRLQYVEMIQTGKVAARPLKADIPANGAVSGQMYSGSGPAAAAEAFDHHLRFKLTEGEVRPRNHAVKVWKRTK